MKKLEDIPKKEIFDVPNGYFDKLPGIIQARVAKEKPSSHLSLTRIMLQYAVPAMIVIIAVLFWFKPTATTDPETILASVQTEALIAFISEANLSTEELLDQVELNHADVENIEDEVYGSSLDREAAEELIDDLELQAL